MNVIVLSGGSGKRLWPLSNDVFSKQFIKIFKNNNGEYESMLQKMYRNIKDINKDSNVTIATSQTQEPFIKEQIGNDVGISIEPCRRDTFPAIALATLYLHDVLHVPEDEAVVVCPVDPYVEKDYFEALDKLCKIAQEGKSNITLMGISPSYPSEKYGYIIPENTDIISRVKMFKEKPDVETAKEYIKQGALWNGGVFAYKLKYVIDIAHKLIDFNDYYDLFNKYETLDKISFDRAVVEKEESIQVLKFDGTWDDLGAWDTLTNCINEDIIGDGIKDDTCNNTHIINKLDIPVVCMGLDNIVVVATEDGILVINKEQSNNLKSFLDNNK